MTGHIDTNETLDTMALLFELSLGIGTSLDLKENCEYFFDRLLSRRNLGTCALFVDEQQMTPLTTGALAIDAQRFVCAYAHPISAARACPQLEFDAPAVTRLALEPCFAIPVDQMEPGLREALCDADPQGVATFFRLGRIGFVICIGSARRDLDDPTSLNRFAAIFEKFGQSVQACLDHSRLIHETARRIDLQDRLARSERMESIGVLAGGIAHDLNNILGPLVALPELVKRRIEPNSPLHKDLTLIESAALQAADVIEDLMVLARRGRPATQVIKLENVLKTFADSAALSAIRSAHPGVRIVCHADTDARIIASPSSLNRALLNLVSNGCEAIRMQGRVEIRATRRSVATEISGYETVAPGDYGVLTVRDTGSGVRHADLGRVFEPFFSTKAMGRRSGTGLGLAIVYGLVKDAGGFVDISTGSDGTCITLYIPNIAEADTRTREPAVIDRESVLVVDDNPQQREMTGRILRDDGYDVVEASTSESALIALARRRPSVVVVDMVLGPTDGVDLYREMLDTAPNLSCVLISGFSQPGRVEEGLALGADSFVRKPFSAGDLCQHVRSALNRAAPPGEI